VLVTSQPWVAGRASTTAEIDALMRTLGFKKAMDGLWYRGEDDLWVSDVLNTNDRTNVITDPYGHVAVINAMIPTLTDRQADGSRT